MAEAPSSTTPKTPVFAAADGLRWLDMDDDEFLVFNPLSGEIHRLNPMAAAVLSEVEARATDLESLAGSLASPAGIDQDPQNQQAFRHQLRDILLQFDEIGLVSIRQRPASPH